MRTILACGTLILSGILLWEARGQEIGRRPPLDRFSRGDIFPADPRLPDVPFAEPANRGLGQTVSRWTHEGIKGRDLADRIHQLQDLRHPKLRQDHPGQFQRPFSGKGPVLPFWGKGFGKGKGGKR